MAYYILIKRKKSKSWLGAIPTRKGITKAKLRKTARSQIKKGFTYRIITASQLKRILKSKVRSAKKRPRSRKPKRKRR